MHRPIGDYYYHAVNMGHGQYKIYKKEPIEPYDDIVDEVLSEMFGRGWKRLWEEIEKQFIKALATHVKSKAFIISSLHLIDTDDKRKEIISFLNNNPNASKKDIEERMFDLSI